MIAAGRPFFPLFLHVLGAMVLVGALIAVVIVSYVAWRRSDVAILRRTAFWSLVAVGIPSYIAMRVGAQWIYSNEGFTGHGDPTWIGIGFAVGDFGLLVLLAAIGVSYWWKRSTKLVAGRILAGLSSIYLVLLAVAWLAMSGKWG